MKHINALTLIACVSLGMSLPAHAKGEGGGYTSQDRAMRAAEQQRAQAALRKPVPPVAASAPAEPPQRREMRK